MNTRVHGGPDGAGAARWDFSTNANAAGPCPQVMAGLREADATRYPDPGYTVLRMRLAALHGVEAGRIVVAASASEFIFRMTAAVGGPTWVPAHAYGDYGQAAHAHARPVVADAAAAQLAWLCEPSSPLGQALERDAQVRAPVTVLDRAYEPLRLSGTPAIAAGELDELWQLWTPNKALGLTGVRAAYAIAPRHDGGMTARLESLAPSWPLGTHGVVLLTAWCEPAVQRWLADSLQTLREWKARQVALCASLGWEVLPSDTNYFCARPDSPQDASALRGHGIRLRDTASFGLPGWARLSVQPPPAQDALGQAWQALRTRRGGVR